MFWPSGPPYWADRCHFPDLRVSQSQILPVSWLLCESGWSFQWTKTKVIIKSIIMLFKLLYNLQLTAELMCKTGRKHTETLLLLLLFLSLCIYSSTEDTNGGWWPNVKSQSVRMRLKNKPSYKLELKVLKVHSTYLLTLVTTVLFLLCRLQAAWSPPQNISELAIR